MGPHWTGTIHCPVPLHTGSSLDSDPPPASGWWLSLETCSNSFTSGTAPNGATSGGYWSMYVWHKKTVSIPLECFLVIIIFQTNAHKIQIHHFNFKLYLQFSDSLSYTSKFQTIILTCARLRDCGPVTSGYSSKPLLEWWQLGYT